MQLFKLCAKQKSLTSLLNSGFFNSVEKLPEMYLQLGKLLAQFF